MYYHNMPNQCRLDLVIKISLIICNIIPFVSNQANSGSRFSEIFRSGRGNHFFRESPKNLLHFIALVVGHWQITWCIFTSRWETYITRSRKWFQYSHWLLMMNSNLARPWRWWGNCEDKTRYSLIKSAIQKWKSHPLEWLGVTRSNDAITKISIYFVLSLNALFVVVRHVVQSHAASSTSTPPGRSSAEE